MDDELATPEDRRYLEGLVSGLDLAHAVALRLGDQAIAERVAEHMREVNRLVVRMRAQHGCESERTVLH
jgi:hypothetical protein